MADNYDEMIRFYYSGKLEVARKIRRAELSAKAPYENIGGGKAIGGHSEPQLSQLIKFDEDDKLNYLDQIETKVKEWVSTFDELTESILILRYKENCQWWQVSDILNFSESTVKKRYREYRDSLERWSEPQNV